MSAEIKSESNTMLENSKKVRDQEMKMKPLTMEH